MSDNYTYRTAPLRHQSDSFLATRDMTAYGLFWEQGVGKTKPMIDAATYLYLHGKIVTLIVIAPPGVQRNWARDELQKHMPEDVLSKACIVVWDSTKSKTQKARREREVLLKHSTGLRIFCISFGAVLIPRAKSFIERLFAKGDSLLVVDESQNIKSPGAKTTKRIVAWGPYATYRRILSGTPITQGAFDVYSQLKFLDDTFWERLSLAPFSVFKTHFGVFIDREQYEQDTGFSLGRGRDKRPVDYKNLEELAGYLKLITHRLTKDSAGIVLPPKVYSKRYFRLTQKQRRVYDELHEEFITQLPESGDWMEAPDTLARLTRLQQITCGYVATETDEPIQRIDSEKNPRLDLLLATLGECEGKAIIWAKYTQDIDYIMAELGDKAVRYDGLVSEDERERNKIDFQEGDVQYFVGKPQSGATGLTLHAARSVHYYSNSYNFAHRAQSEDRAHRIGLKHSVTYYDYIAEHSIDEQIVTNLRKKGRFSAMLLGDAEKDWI